MTLSRQLIAMFSVVLLILFIGALLASVHNTRHYLQLQLHSHAQDTATSLGLSLRPHLQDKDIAAMDTMVNAIFDRGYYKQLLITDIAGAPLVERNLELQLEEVPAWFVDLFPIEAPEAETLITSGWTQSGRLSISSHPGYAYQQLWATAQDTLTWTLLAFTLALIAIFAFLRLTLRPLFAMEAQADAVCRREFPTLEPLPRTRELRRVVMAMNRMTTQLKQMLEDLTQQLERFRQRAYTDRLTNLPNRSGFEARLQALLGDSESAPQGALWLIRLRNLDRFNQIHGLEAGDDLLRHAAFLLDLEKKQLPQSICARLSGSDFVLLAPGIDAQTLTNNTQRVHQALQGLGSMEGSFNIAALLYGKNQSLSELLSRADLALSKAESKGPDAIHCETVPVSPGAHPVSGSQQWRQLLNDALETGSPYLLSQPVIAINRTHNRSPLFSELLVRIPQDDQPSLVAGAFVPMAERLQLAPKLDQLVIEKALAHLRKKPHASLSVNLSCASLLDATFNAWLLAQLQQEPHLARLLVFEILEQSAVKSLENTQHFVDSVRQCGARVALEHFGLQSLGFHQLRRLRTDYLKIDGSFSQGIATQEDHQFFIRTLCEIARGLDMLVIAEQVETAEDLASLQKLGVNAAQGYHLGRPEQL